MATKRARLKGIKRKPPTKQPLEKSQTADRLPKRAVALKIQVAELYRLLGARVTQNVEIHQTKVDILATFRIPGSSREHSVIVECKDEQRSVAANQRIMAFKGLLDLARNTGVADSAEIVTRVPWSDQAKGFAKPGSSS